jgi:Rrf2 family protein
MKLITHDADYAIKALLAITRRSGEVTAVPELVATLGIPRPYLRKIMQTLARAGVVRSSRGRGGGFVLGPPAGKIFLADVIRIFQGPISFHDCLFRERICPDVRTCPLRETIGRLESRLVKDLETLSVASLLGGEKGRPRSRKACFKGGGSPEPSQKRRKP